MLKGASEKPDSLIDRYFSLIDSLNSLIAAPFSLIDSLISSIAVPFSLIDSQNSSIAANIPLIDGLISSTGEPIDLLSRRFSLSTVHVVSLFSSRLDFPMPSPLKIESKVDSIYIINFTAQAARNCSQHNEILARPRVHGFTNTIITILLLIEEGITCS
ncbi:hypothetical protein FZC79_17460 [Rossellomorea vietnamensis]|uniref:Uncharacterized protein n=1 Tax=Rossellomorea vietnamensis TaxID=218284 RepID=A0A5D4K8J8_9BACI|nr:hypothetical protein [Rossellomorea vietnamensis]TYR73664.1 hypothetical protein FZC79_17460 [Rossellomorea vietnamensis]